MVYVLSVTSALWEAGADAWEKWREAGVRLGHP